MDDNRDLSYFFLGLGVGIAVGMIFAPQAGAETRSLIRDRASEGGDYLLRKSSDLREGANTLMDRGKDLLSRQKDQVSAAVDAGRQAYRETVGTGAPGLPESQPLNAGENL